MRMDDCGSDRCGGPARAKSTSGSNAGGLACVQQLLQPVGRGMEIAEVERGVQGGLDPGVLGEFRYPGPR